MTDTEKPGSKEARVQQLKGEKKAKKGDHQGEAPPKPKPGRPKSRMKMVLWLVRQVQGHTQDDAPPFPDHFAVLQDSADVRRAARILPGDVVAPVEDSVVTDAIMQYTHLLPKNPQLTPAQAKDVFSIWRSVTPPIRDKDILDIAEKSTPGYTWHRLPFDIKITGKPTPTFDEMMGRIPNARALMAWIGGLLLDGTERQQYLYLYGSGENGKGRLNDFLHRLMGRSYRAERIDKEPNQFWTSGLIGARLVAFPDFDSPAIFERGWFKGLTGSDPIRIEPKNQGSYTAVLSAKFFFIGNTRPSIADNPANRRRIIFCEIAPLPAGTARIPTRKYEEMLWDEGAEWLAKCMGEWTTVAGETGIIVVEDDEPLRRIMDCAEEQHLVLAEKWLEFGQEKFTKPAEMQAILNRERIKAKWDQGKWYKFLEQRFSVHSVKRRLPGARDDGDRERVYRGCSVRESMRGALDAGF